MAEKVNYPTQMASIKKDDWRLKKYLNRSNKELEKIENDLWKTITNIVKIASKPVQVDGVGNGEILGFGWEWVVYNSEDDHVVKIPRDIFQEVSRSEYLENIAFAYEVSKKYYDDLLPETEYSRKLINKKETNCVMQEKLEAMDAFAIDENLSNQQRQQLTKFINASLRLIEEWSWFPDVKPQKISSGFIKKEKWQVWNMSIDKNGNLKLMDLVPYYDVFRLYPERTEKEKVWKKENLLKFKKFVESL